MIFKLVKGMGNSSNKSNHRHRGKYASQHSIYLSSIIGGSCSGRSSSVQEEYYRPWSRVSRRCWSVSTLNDPLSSSKTAWPVAQFQALFLPQFKIREEALKEKYKFLELINKGTYGRVYKVKDRRIEKIYALKVISKAKIVAEDSVEQVKQEVSIQEVVGHHPFVAHTLEHWQGRQTLYISGYQLISEKYLKSSNRIQKSSWHNLAMEYYGRGELFSLIDDYGCLPENVVRIYVGELALALDFLHNAGIVHRDVKPSNVLLDNEGHGVLIDFGFAKWLSPTHKTSTFCGTLEYMAPEIMRKEYYGHAVDWWSLGVLACFALTNQYPAKSTESICGGSSNEGQEQVAEEIIGLSAVVLPSMTNLSRASVDLLRRLLQPDPQLRIKSVSGLQRIAFYMGEDIRSYTTKKVSPLTLLGKKLGIPLDSTRVDQQSFAHFDSFVAGSTNNRWDSIDKL